MKWRSKCPRKKLTILLDLITQGAMPKAGGHPVHHQRTPLLQPGFNQQRRWRRGYREGEREGVSDRVDEHEPELGTELAVQLRAGGPVSLLPRCSQRPPLLHLLEHRPRKLAVRPDLRRQKLQSLNNKNKKTIWVDFRFPALIIIIFLRHFFVFLFRFCFELLTVMC